MKGQLVYILMLILAIALYVLSIQSSPQEIDWTVSLNKADKIPFGTYVFYKQLPSLFPEANIKTTNTPVYNVVSSNKSEGSVYFLVNNELNLTETDMSNLLEFVERGNTVFISTYSCNILDDFLGLSNSYGYTDSSASSTLKISDERLAYNLGHLKIQEAGYSSFSQYDTAKALTLGKDLGGNTNFLRTQVGKGSIYVYSQPKIFSNYFLLYRQNASYVASALRFIPSGVKTVYWDEYYLKSKTKNKPLLGFILSQPGLSFAFGGTLILLLLFILFESKRRQKIIPLIEPVKNTTLEFSETVGLLYFKKHQNLNIALKMIQQLQDYITTRYFIQTNKSDQDFIKVLSSKSGVNAEFLAELFHTIAGVQQSKDREFSDQELLTLNRDIDFFYKSQFNKQEKS